MPKLTEEKIAELRARLRKPYFGMDDWYEVVHSFPGLLDDLEEARRERDQYSLMFQNSDQHAKQLQQAYTDAISGRKAYCHLCHQFFEGHPDGHGLGECVAVCGSCFINATKKDDELCDSCKRAESAERALAEARQGWIPVSERLPEVDQQTHESCPVLTGDFPCFTPHVAWYDKDNDEWVDFWRSDVIPAPTHWRPLPAPPEVK